jgi:NADH-quinone oxidoreductase subunit J
VYARHNAVDMAARLPDGSDADTSVSGILPPRTMAAARKGEPR